MLAKFTTHPTSVNETYFQHMKSALTFSLTFLGGSIIALIHAFFPFLFEKTGSQLITHLHQKMVNQRIK